MFSVFCFLLIRLHRICNTEPKLTCAALFATRLYSSSTILLIISANVSKRLMRDRKTNDQVGSLVAVLVWVLW